MGALPRGTVGESTRARPMVVMLDGKVRDHRPAPALARLEARSASYPSNPGPIDSFEARSPRSPIERGRAGSVDQVDLPRAARTDDGPAPISGGPQDGEGSGRAQRGRFDQPLVHPPVDPPTPIAPIAPAIAMPGSASASRPFASTGNQDRRVLVDGPSASTRESSIARWRYLVVGTEQGIAAPNLIEGRRRLARPIPTSAQRS